MSNNIHENDIGTKFKVRIILDSTGEPADISDATTKTIVFKPPSNAAMIEKVAVFSTDGIDGYIEYITEAGDLTPNGNWSLQANVIGPGYENSSETTRFKVLPNLE